MPAENYNTISYTYVTKGDQTLLNLPNNTLIPGIANRGWGGVLPPTPLEMVQKIS